MGWGGGLEACGITREKKGHEKKEGRQGKGEQTEAQEERRQRETKRRRRKTLDKFVILTEKVHLTI